MSNASIRYGAKIRKQYAAVKKQKKVKYKCEVCGSVSVKRISNAIWNCTHCGTIYAGGSYTLTTRSGEVANRIIESLKKGSKPTITMQEAIEEIEKE
ncbi:MAG: hypothetical protein QXD11_00655 [Candidatus Micrarchaeaceae archaeon]